MEQIFQPLYGKTVSVEKLKPISDANYKVYNRSLDCDLMLSKGMTELRLIFIIKHNHAFGIPTGEHVRLVFSPGYTQDMTYQQMISLFEEDIFGQKKDDLQELKNFLSIK